MKIALPIHIRSSTHSMAQHTQLLNNAQTQPNDRDIIRNSKADLQGCARRAADVRYRELSVEEGGEGGGEGKGARAWIS
eukprot:752908-Hanusia_phi.AAC.3